MGVPPKFGTDELLLPGRGTGVELIFDMLGSFFCGAGVSVAVAVAGWDGELVSLGIAARVFRLSDRYAGRPSNLAIPASDLVADINGPL
jgi:hypothetical protein